MILYWQRKGRESHGVRTWIVLWAQQNNIDAQGEGKIEESDDTLKRILDTEVEVIKNPFFWRVRTDLPQHQSFHGLVHER